MQDFNDFIKENSQDENSNKGNQNIINLVSMLANKFNGKDKSELIKAIYKEAEKGKKNGTLSNGDIDNFSAILSPMLDEKQGKILSKITENLKKI